MSKVVDERVVSMQFDNRHFEKNVSTTMSTLDKLKQKLNLTGAAKGLDGINASAKNVNLNPLSQGVEAVTAKFSALQVMGVTALANITNSAVNAGKRIVSALTIDPIKTGWNEYELKMNSIQTIMASTGESLETVNKYLNELNEYSDKTIYSFSDMTQNIGKFTNAGVSLDDAVLAMKGISNEAALSGANANEASRAMYNLAQSISMGYVQLIDWKSIENANMATVGFKEQLLKTAVSLDVISESADGYTTSTGKSYNIQQMFKDGLQEQWLTTDVLISTLRDYADENTEIGKKASQAATEVKTFTMMLDTLKESAQSGWAQTWEIIFGDFEKGKNLWTSLSNIIGGMLDTINNFRNSLLQGALDIASPWSAITEKIENSGLGKITKVAKKVEDATDKVKKFQETVSKVWRGDFGNADTGRYELLEKAGYDHRVIQDLVNKGSEYKITVEDIDASHKKFGLTLDKTTESTKKTAVSMEDLSDEQLRNAGLTEDEIRLYRDLQKEAKRTGKSIDQLVKEMSEMDGRELLIDSFKNAWKGLVTILSAVRDAWNNVFPPASSVRLYGIIKSVNEFSKQLIVSEETAGKVQNAFEGIFSVLKTVGTVAFKVISAGAKISWSVFKLLGNIILTVASAFGKATTKMSDFGSKAFSPIIDVASGFIDFIVNFVDFINESFGDITTAISESVGKWVEDFKETKAFETVAGYVQSASDTISGALSNMSSWMNGFKFSDVGKTVLSIFSFIGDSVKDVANSEIAVSAINTIASGITKFVDFIKGVKLPDMKTFDLTGWIRKFTQFLADNNLSGFMGTITGFFKFLGSQASYKISTFKKNALNTFSDFYLKYGDSIKEGFNKAKEVLKSIVEFVFGSEQISLPTILDLAEKFLAIVALIKVISIFDNISGSFQSISDTFENISKAAKWRAIGESFKAMAIALGAFAACMYVIGKMDATSAWRSAGILTGVLFVMVGLVSALIVLSGKTGALNMGTVAAVLIGLGVCLGILVWTLKTIDGTEFNDLGRSFTIMAGVLVGIAIAIGVIGKLIGKTSLSSVAAILTMLTALKMVLGVIESYSAFNWSEHKKTIPKMLGMLLALAVALRVASGGASNAGSALLIIAMVVSLKLLLSTIEELGGMDQGKMWRGIAGVIAILGGMTGMLVAINLTSKGGVLKKGEKAINSFKGLAIALLATCAAIYILGKMDTDTLLQGGAAVIVLLGMFALIMNSISKGGAKKTSTVVTMLVGFGLLLGEMYFIIKGLSSIGWEKSLGSAAALSLLLVAISGCLLMLSKHRIQAKTMYKWISALTTMSMIVGLLGAVLIGMAHSGVDPLSAVGQVAAISIMLGAMTACLLVLTKHNKIKTSNIQKWVGALATMSLVVGILGVVLSGMAHAGVDPVASIGQFAAISLMLVAMSACLYVLGSVKVDGTNVLKWVGLLGAMSLVVGILGVVLAGLSHAGVDGGQAIGQVAALSLLMVAMSGCIAIMAKVIKSSDIAGIAIGIVALAAMAVPLLAFVGVLSVAQGIQNALDNAIVLSMLTSIMTVLLLPLTLIGSFAGAALLGVLSLTAMAIPLIAFVGVLAVMQNVQSAETNAIILSRLATVLTVLLVPLTIIGALAGAALMGVLALTAMAVPMLAFVGVLAVMNMVENAMTNAMLLSMFMTTMGDLLVKISIVAPLAVIGVAAMSALTLLMGAIGVMAVAIGALMEKFPALQSFLDTGITVMIQLAGGIGEMIGAFVNGVLSNIAAGLPQIGLNLSMFMTNTMPFILGAKLVDSAVLEGVGILAAAIIALTAADLIAGFASFLQSGSSFADLGTQLSQFIINATPFILGMSMVKPEMLDTVKTLVETILLLTGANLLESITSFITGESSLENFGTQLSYLGTGLANFSSNLGGFSEDQLATVTAAAKAIKILAQASATIPNSGGLLGDLVGDNDLGVFAKQFPVLGGGLKYFLQNVGDFTDDQVATVTCAANAIKVLAEASSEIPNTGGWLAQLIGDNDLATFAAQFPLLGTALTEFLANVGEFSDDQVTTVTCAANAIKVLAEASSEIPNTGGWLAQLVGDNSLESFAEQFPALGTGLSGFLENIGEFSEDQIETVSAAANAIKVLAEASSQIPNSGGWLAEIVGDNELGTFADQFPAVGTGIKGFADNLGEFGDGTLKTVKVGIKAVKAISELAGTDLSSVNTAIGTFGTKLANFGKKLGEFCSNIADVGGEALTNAIEKVNEVKTMIKGLAGVDADAAARFKDAIEDLGKTGFDEFVDAFTGSKATSDVKSAAKKMIENFIKAAEDKAKSIKSAFEGLGDEAIDGIEKAEDDFESAGKDLGSGLVRGIKAKETAAYNAGYALGQKAVQGEKDGQESNSPSKATIRSGKDLGRGLIIGIDKMGKSVYAAGSNMGENATMSISGAMSRAMELLDGGMDSQPTIRPVLDLSDVTAGANSINDMFGTNPSMRLLTNVGSISSMMNSRNQNGANGDVLAAIKELGQTLSGNTGNTYQVNGVTYDDGTNIAEAVKALIREARIERRR